MKRIRKEKKMKTKIINSRSILNCVGTEEIKKHETETNEVIQKIVKYKDYPCALLCKYHDEFNKSEKKKFYDCFLSEVFGELKRFDSKNGIDLHMDDDGYLNFKIYGSYKDNGLIETTGVKVLPLNEDNNYMDISGVVFGNGVAIESKQQSID